jgi:hypothetical protein
LQNLFNLPAVKVSGFQTFLKIMWIMAFSICNIPSSLTSHMVNLPYRWYPARTRIPSAFLCATLAWTCVLQLHDNSTWAVRYKAVHSLLIGTITSTIQSPIWCTRIIARARSFLLSQATCRWTRAPHWPWIVLAIYWKRNGTKFRCVLNQTNSIYTRLLEQF